MSTAESDGATLPARLVAALTGRSLTIGTAESLTGGRLVAGLVDVPGASRCVAGGVVAYSYAVKARVLGLDLADLDARGAVRAVVAERMAEGAARTLGCDLALATTGVAGPGPDANGVPAGTVWVALCDARHGRRRSRRLVADGDRDRVRDAAAAAALVLLAEELGVAAPRATGFLGGVS